MHAALRILALAAVTGTDLACTAATTQSRPPNVVYVMADELAYYELSHLGNPYLRTPHIDAMAAEGLRFTHAYAGAPVCAPLRCNLMTGKHAGHASVRANDGGTPLRAGEPTIASVLKARGYATGGFGKWGCGGRDSTGIPEEHGFDVFFGYYDQVHAHSYYPPYLIRNSEEVVLEGNVGGRSGQTYSHYVILDEARAFLREHRDEPFFCYLPITPPHGMYDIPANDPAWQLYEDAEWLDDPAVTDEVRNYAAMVSMVDRNLGELLELLRELDLEDETIVFFTGDNGGQDRFRSDAHPRGFFGPNVDPLTGDDLRGQKGDLHEGGLRIPFLVRWPGRIEAGRVSELVFYQPDVLPTLAELCGAEAPDDVDGHSILAEILGTGPAPAHEFLYWEFGNQTAVRSGDWKGVRHRTRRGDESWELFDLATDLGEDRDVADQHPEIVARLAAIAAREHTPAQSGSYTDPARTRHERDRQAKWGTSGAGPTGNRPAAVQRLEDRDLIPAAGLRVVSASSENSANGKRAAHAVDGDPRTIWHSRWSEDPARPPHELVIDLGAEHQVRGLRYLARQDASWNGAFGDVELWLGRSLEDLAGEPTARGTFQRVRTAQALDLATPVRARFARLRVLTEAGGGTWASAAEIGFVERREK